MRYTHRHANKYLLRLCLGVLVLLGGYRLDDLFDRDGWEIEQLALETLGAV
jgi:hypothetical protein